MREIVPVVKSDMPGFVGEQLPTKRISRWFYMVEILLVLLALGVYVGIYFLNTLSPGITSYYYSKNYSTVSPFIVGVSSVPQPQFTAPTLIKSIAFNWIMWKAANILVILDMLAPFTWHRKLIGVGVFSLVMFAIDWALFVLLHEYCYDFGFVGISWVVSMLLSIALFCRQEKQPFRVTLGNSFAPYFSYSLLIAVYWLAMPQLFKVLVNNINGIYGTLIFFYLFPVIDTLLVLFNWLMQGMVSPRMKLFVSTASNWLLQGYRLGIICRLSFCETDLYYQIFWILFRNLLFNWVANKSEFNRLNLSMPGWIIAYYLSVLLNYLPVCGVNNLVTSNYYTSFISLSRPYIFPSNPYFPTTSSVSSYNLTFSGNIMWFVPLIVWVVESVTQKYHLYEFNWRMAVYNLFGIYLFYNGLVSALGIYTLGEKAFMY